MSFSNGGGDGTASDKDTVPPADHVDGNGIERASCGDMVQSNGTCGSAYCDNYGKP